MSYDFGQRRIGAGDSQERNGGMYTKTLLGQSISESPIPSWTADKSGNPFVAFQDSKTKKLFGMSKAMLAYGLLAIGAAGNRKDEFLQYGLRAFACNDGTNGCDGYLRYKG